MKTTYLKKSVYALAAATVILALLAGCASQKNSWGSKKSGYILTYQMHDGKDLKYGQHSDVKQTMKVMEENVDVNTSSLNLFTINPDGMANGNYNLEVSIDTMSMLIKSPRGELKPEMSGVIGKSFDFVISPLGREIDCSGAESITYELGMAGERSISANFQTLFPNLPEDPVKIGDSWISTDTVTEKSDNGKLQILSESVNTFKGFETVNGYDCVKINSETSGLLTGSGSMQGLNTITTGTIEGVDTWYFAYKEGIFVKMISNGKANTTTLTSGAREMTIPSERNYTIVTEVKL